MKVESLICRKVDFCGVGEVLPTDKNWKGVKDVPDYWDEKSDDSKGKI